MKQVKDPVYGYIEFDEFYWDRLIDTPEFQRLRHVSQTGYRALFPSAHHNRFVHSLGVAHLGTVGFQNFQANIQDKGFDVPWETLENTFIVACLLHDVGHSPFSHTGEKFYEEAVGERYIAERLKSIVGREGFAVDLDDRGYGKPHEAMSAIVGSWLYSRAEDSWKADSRSAGERSFDVELFARAIIGLTYSEGGKEVENALISLLNGAFIDVDKLDYIMRDSFTTGYSSLLLDYGRLLAGYTLVQNEEGKISSGFKRKSVSVIENVIYAKDLERKWIQQDPTILYDSRVVEYLIQEFAAYHKRVFTEHGIFVEDALTSKGIVLSEGDFEIKRRLLCDDDIVFFAKNISTSEAAEQFFSRMKRLKPLWKTELEYRTLLETNLNGAQKTRWQRATDLLAEELKNRSLLSIDETVVEMLEKDIEFADNLMRRFKSEKMVDMRKLSGIKERKERALELCLLLRSFCEMLRSSVGGEFDFKFYLITSSSFMPDYDFDNFGSILIDVGGGASVSMKDEATIAKKIVRNSAGAKHCFLYTTVKNKKLCSDLSERFWCYLKGCF